MTSERLPKGKMYLVIKQDEFSYIVHFSGTGYPALLAATWQRMPLGLRELNSFTCPKTDYAGAKSLLPIGGQIRDYATPQQIADELGW